MADAVKVTVWPTWGEDEDTCKVAERGGVVITVTVWELFAVCEGEDESVAVSVTVKDPMPVYTWVVEAPVPEAPSPKLQPMV